MSAATDGKQVKIAFQLRIGDGVDTVYVFAEKFEVTQVVFDVLPALQQRFVPRMLGGGGMAAGIKTVGGEAVVLPVQLFGQYQLRQSSEMREVAARHKAVV